MAILLALLVMETPTLRAVRGGDVIVALWRGLCRVPCRLVKRSGHKAVCNAFCPLMFCVEVGFCDSRVGELTNWAFEKLVFVVGQAVVFLALHVLNFVQRAIRVAFDGATSLVELVQKRPGFEEARRSSVFPDFV